MRSASWPGKKELVGSFSKSCPPPPPPPSFFSDNGYLKEIIMKCSQSSIGPNDFGSNEQGSNGIFP